jgi:carbonic anhydrase
MPSDFEDLLAANQAYADTFENAGLAGVARAGVAIVTCMDSRIDPLAILGLSVGDAKVVRNPGGRVTPAAMDALVLAVHLLGVDRILVVPHTRCAVASNSEAELLRRLEESSGQDASWMPLPVTDDQASALEQDVHRVRAHPLIPDTVLVGGFVYDVDSGRLDQRV